MGGPRPAGGRRRFSTIYRLLVRWLSYNSQINIYIYEITEALICSDNMSTPEKNTTFQYSGLYMVRPNQIN
ncbi:hypothetical protein PFDG_05337 [Plasmodium falciparum Dd2]|uniref:Uncharacterized protein n=1 Tax=Plasmodium falciparum (isolate Dd2) TaxID=57267 RepID=A0A0L7MAB6_PLAF4|nr:hypothetical protein PFDG_05337 [Plasmodium falciparum Dd2]